ncbi:acyltransferase family protein [Sphingobacterium corticibacter]|uniref:Acyltransferase n=1 Tax=Sphingobacterium corticibacter TaxID=2171749 RepID=A0A2T8HNJ2_9SPHI|nr:acyltransferase family protein [Sphingobacterium corticibacter]PVH27019.1 hypothetical protein DC487_05330 [Sphingobacterium corticibacter]
MIASNNFRYDISFLRCIAVLAVVLYHFKFPYTHGGFIGVDIFFVISGYLMTKIVLTGIESTSFDLLSFYLRRVVRIFPALMFLLVAVFFLTQLFLGLKIPGYIDSAIWSSVFLSNIKYYLTSGYFDGASKTNLLLHTWSLSVEWQFYMIYPIFLLFINKIFKSRIAMIVGISTLTLISFILCAIYSIKDQSLAFYMVHTRAWEMLLGGIAFVGSQWAERIMSLQVRSAITMCSLLTLALCITNVIPVAHYGWPSALTLIPAIVTFLVILSNSNVSIFTWRLPNFISDVSYSWYLWHWPIAVFALYFTVHEGVNNKILLIMLSFVAAICSYFFVEKKMYHWKPSYLLYLAGSIFTLFLLISNLDYSRLVIYDSEKKIINDFYTYKDSIAPRQYDFGRGHILSTSNFQDWDQSHLDKIRPDVDNYLLIGDSHAGMFGNLMPDIALTKNVNILQASGDATFPSPASHTDFEAPKDLFKYIFDSYIPENHQHFKGVVISANYASYDDETLLNYIDSTEKYFAQFDIPVIYIGQTESYIIDYPIANLLSSRYGVSLNRYIDHRTSEANNFLKNSHIASRYVDIYDVKSNTSNEDETDYIYDAGHLSVSGLKMYKDILEREVFEKFISN